MNLDVADDDLMIEEAAIEPQIPLTPFAQRVVAILWPSFLMAGLLEMLVFAFVDPEELHWLGGAALDLSRGSVYTLAFFVFWLVVSLAGALSHLLLIEPNEVNAPVSNRQFP
ncbi:MAG: hypothetical protein RLY71_3851 [Pseudomonadota bacterium]|jgi:hypothetical protein